MYLKALEIQGFKSFPEKVRLSFEKEITAIVGPNGSGKSNISDAISWVLGEQRTKALRGSKMEDVIFGGTQELGKLSFAQVSLILDNSAGAFSAEPGELTVTRRYYRSGESEYYINKRSVRLKDVNELFMDTGLGRDGYSMIGQGRVDEILAAKSIDRREVFEEAAGISRYRYRREESQRKLDRTAENLVRVNDKISELELSVEPLRKQAEVAKKYLTLRDELRGLEISIWMDALDKLGEKSAALREEYADMGDALEKAKAELQAMYGAAEEFSGALREREERSEELRAEISALEGRAADKDSELAVKQANIKSNNETIDRLSFEISEQTGRDGSLREQIEHQRARIGEITAELASIDADCAALTDESGEADSAASESEAEMNSLLAAAAAEENAAAAARARHEALVSALNEQRARVETAKSEREGSAERLETERSALKARKKELGEQKEALTSIENRIAGFRMKAAQRAKKAEELKERRTALEMEENRVASRVQLLGDMKKEYEGFSRAVKAVMQAQRGGALKNVHGTVAELIRVPDEYTMAVETALGDSMQHIVVDREEDGKAGINMLKRRDAGRATFLPISVIRGSELELPELEDEPGVIGLASRLIDYKDKYAPIVRNLLGHVVVVEDLESAIGISRRVKTRMKMVTLDGQVMNVGGSMTGGSAAKNVGIISRANELDSLRASLEKIKAELSESGAELGEAQRLSAEAEYETELLQTELRETQDAVLKLETEISQREFLCASLEEADSQNAKTLEAGESLIRKSEADCAEAQSEAGKHEKAALELREKIAALTRGREEQLRRLNALTERLNAMRSRASSLMSEQSAVERHISEWEGLLAEFSAQADEKKAAITALRQKGTVLSGEAAMLENEAAALRSEIEAVRARLDENIARRNEAEARRAKNEKLAQEKNGEIVELERAWARVEQRKQAADMEEKQLVDKLWDTYELSRSAAQRQRMELESVSKATKRASELKREISALGTPNIGAIDEYERVNGRYTYLTGQRDDILGAMGELEKLIGEVTREMEEIFLTQFRLINENFKETFRELFGGGAATLELEDEADVLNCGVEIRVQPPGKTQKTLTLLSGGERAFVAIALYFAIMKVRPTPFCVLDEIESALDEKNVARFADYLHKVCANTQFLVITHRRGSMERADVLYGVTMQKGVSKVLSIDLEEALKKY